MQEQEQRREAIKKKLIEGIDRETLECYRVGQDEVGDLRTGRQQYLRKQHVAVWC